MSSVSSNVYSDCSCQDVEAIFDVFQALNPFPKTELFYVNTYTLVVAVILSARMTDKGVNKVTKKLFQEITTPSLMLSLTEEGLKEEIKTIGLYPTKAKNIIALSKILVEAYNGAVPTSKKELEDLPGIGPKSANLVMNVVFNQSTIPVDTHVSRVSQRIGLASKEYAKTPLAIEKALEATIPKRFLHDAHHWLVLHGRYICKSRKPSCATCPINKLCLYDKKENNK